MFHFLRSGGSVGGQTVVTMPDETTSRRPTIALALGGGAARGFAHIGVIRALVAKGFKPDVIAGTSIGAVVGGCYAAGKLDDIEQWARSLTRRRLFSYLDVSLGGLGLISGTRVFEALSEAIGDVKIEALPLRFAAIATEIGTGHEIWLTRGRLADALRASHALPGIFPAVQVGERWLMDGALVNPVPVSAARALGARIVIAVNVNTDLFGRGTTIQDFGAAEAEPPIEEEVVSRGLLGMFGAEKSARRHFFGTAARPGLSNVMVEAFNVMQDRITRARLAGDPPDVMISPRIGRVGLFDFQRAEEAIAIGAEATEKALESFGDVVAALA
jgi:NTE family protein